jgi:pseudomonalisin
MTDHVESRNPLKKGFVRRLSWYFLVVLAPGAAQAQSPQPPSDSALRAAAANPMAVFPKDQLSAPVNETAWTTLHNSVHSLARPDNDAGPVAPDSPMSRMTLALQRSPEQQAALDAFSEAVQDPGSPLYHKWLTPQQFGEHFGLTQNDLDRVSAWLTSKGLTIDEIPAGRWTIVFSGTVAQVQAAFHTAIHNYRLPNGTFFSNSVDPQVPQSLAELVMAVDGLNNFPTSRSPNASVPQAVTVSGAHFLDPTDFYTIYDVGPLYGKGLSGSGVNIAVIESCTMDISLAGAYWAFEGISSQGFWYTDYGTPFPCRSGDMGEVFLDIEWAQNLAQGAKVWLVAAQGNDPVFNAIQDVVSGGLFGNAFPAVLSVSYSTCGNPTSYVQLVSSVFQQAHSEGISALIASGDWGAAACDAGDPASQTVANHGLSINDNCQSLYVTCVGGTEFNDFANPSQYWSPDGQALGYIPEVAWNETNGASIMGATGGGYSTLFAKPPWQSQNPTGFRGVPDVALTAAGHDAYRVCLTASGCNLNFIQAIAGTSAAAPSLAGIVALLVQAYGPQGNLNQTMYALAARNDVGLVFHDITAGNNSVAGQNGYSAGPGWDPVTGLGSIDANAFVTNWQYAFAPEAVLTTSNLNLGTEPVGKTTAAQTLTITNQAVAPNLSGGAATLTISSVKLGGSNPNDFPSTTSCASNTLAAGGNCTITVTFQPTANGVRTATITVVDNSPNSPHIITLTGTGTSGSGSTGPTVITKLTSNTNGIVNGACTTPPSVSSFTPNSPLVWIYFVANGATVGDAVTINFIRPDGTVNFSVPTSAPFPNSCFSYAMSISGTQAANFLGTWTIQVLWNNAPLFSLNFTLSNTTSSNGNYFVPVTPCRLVDTRGVAGSFGGPSISGGATRNFPVATGPCSIPSSATAYSLNVTVVPHGSLGYLTIWPTGQSQPGVSTLNSLDGRIKANAAIVPAGANGSVSVYVTNTTDVILDINGYFVPSTTAGALALYTLPPCRVVDTRNASGSLGGPSLAGKIARTFPVLSSPCGVPSSAQAYSMTFTAVPNGGLGYVTTWPTGVAQPLVSSLNDPTGTIAANAAIVPAGNGGAINVFASDNTNLVLDINGYFAAPGSGLAFYPLAPCRVLDTRANPGAPLNSGSVNVLTSSCGVPSSARALVYNATVVPFGPLGYLTLWPDGQSQPLVSTLNAPDGAITSNMAIVPTNNGVIDVFASPSTHLILDISGYFAP